MLWLDGCPEQWDLSMASFDRWNKDSCCHAKIKKQDGKPYNGPAARGNVKMISQKLLVARILVPRSPTDVVAPIL